MLRCKCFANGIQRPGAVTSGRERIDRSLDAAGGRWLPQDDARCRQGEVCSSPPSDTIKPQLRPCGQPPRRPFVSNLVIKRAFGRGTRSGFECWVVPGERLADL